MTLADVLRFLSLFCGGIATGTWVVTQVALIPARRELAPDASLQLHVVTSREIDRYNPLLTSASIIAGLLIVVLGLAPTPASRLWTALGCASMMGAGLTSILRNMPINRRIASWPAGKVPAEYSGVQQEWARGNFARTLMGLLGFASYLLAVV
jgi:hypothetical protein